MTFDGNFKLNETYERGAALLVTLAYPGPDDAGRNFQLYLSLCGNALWRLHMDDPDDWTPIIVKPQYVFRDRETIDRDVSFIARRLGERMVAGRMAVPFFWRIKLGDAMVLPNEIKRLSINQMAEFVLDDAELADPDNVEKRFWRPSLPVIHLATAAVVVCQQRMKAGQSLKLESFLFNRELIEEVVSQADEFATLVRSDPKFPAKFEELIRFRLT
jgi:hypothetical protein